MMGSNLLFAANASANLKTAIEPHDPEPRHGLNYTNPATVWDEAFPLGNGLMGALVWGEGHPFKISLDRTDLWDLRPVPEYHSPEYRFETMRAWHQQGRHKDLVRLYEDPYNRPAPTKIPAGRIALHFPQGTSFERASLSLSNALAEVRFNDESQIQVFVHAREPIGFIRVNRSDPRNRGSALSVSEMVRAQLEPPPFGGRVNEAASGGITAGDLAQLGYPAPLVTSGSDWQAYTQTGAEGFAFAVFLGWRECNGQWIAVWSIATNREDPNPLRLARQRVERALRRGFDSSFAMHADWWRHYWRASSVTVPNPVIERQWFLEQYKFGAASRRGSPPITLQGPWTADNGQLPPWKGDYHHDLNTQLSYWPCYSGNHLEEGLSYLDWLWNTREACREWTRQFFELPGLNVPMTADLNNRQIGGWRQYTHSATTAAWLAQHFYLHWKYSADRRFLRTRAYPYLREACVFLEAISTNRDSAGKRTLPLSASPEINDNRPEAWFENLTNYDLALMRWLFGAATEMADVLNHGDDARRWRAVLSELPEFSRAPDGALLVAKHYPLKESHRHFSHLMALHPLGLIDWQQGPDAQQTIQASLADLDRLGTDWWCGYSFAWLGNLAARAYDGSKAARALETFASAFTLRNSFHCNGDQSGKGLSKFTYRPFTLEGNFAMAAGLQEMLLQSHRGYIEVFPAIPVTWTNAMFTTLRAEGAFLISAVRRNGKVQQVTIKSEKGGLCRLRSPFSGKILSLPLRRGQTITLMADPPRN